MNKQQLEAILSIGAAAIGSLEAMNTLLQSAAFLVAIGSGSLSIYKYFKDARKKGN